MTLWTLKEAYVKAIGTGLTLELNTLEFRIDGNLERRPAEAGRNATIECWRDGIRLNEWTFGAIEWRGHLVAWAVEGGAAMITSPSIDLVTLEQIT